LILVGSTRSAARTRFNDGKGGEGNRKEAKGNKVNENKYQKRERKRRQQHTSDDTRATILTEGLLTD
jgi:hypothetical protein